MTREEVLKHWNTHQETHSPVPSEPAIECAVCGRTRFKALLVDRVAHCCAGGWLALIHHEQTYGGPEHM